MDSTTISLPRFKKISQGRDEGQRKDMFSNLPDSIIHYILSLLPLKDAVKTSLLAKRWKYLWTQLSDFNFEFDLSYRFKKEGQNQKHGANYFDLVDRLFCEANYIQKFRLASGIPVNVQRANSWISSALKHNVKELDLSVDVKSAFVLPHSFSTSGSLNKLTLELGRVLCVPNCIHFPGLKTLNLSCITFGSKKSAQQLFSGSPLLQELSFHNCGWKNIKDISISMPTLKTLKISNDVFHPDDLLNCKVNIDAMNLQSFSCSCYLTVEFAPINLASLVDAYIDIMDSYQSRPVVARRARKLLSGLCNVKSLSLSNDTLDCLFSAEYLEPSLLPALCTFHSLIHLNAVEGSYNYTSDRLIYILQMSPNLEVLDIPQVHLDDDSMRAPPGPV